MNAKMIWTLLKETFKEWSDDRATRLAAALAYYAAIATAPLVVGVISIAGFIYSTEQAQAELMTQIQTFVGGQAAGMVETIIDNAAQPELARVAGLLSLATLLWAASNVFAQLQDALNTIWGVEPDPELGLLQKGMHRLLPLLMVLGIGVLLLVAIVASSAISALEALMPALPPGVPIIWQVINFVISVAVITVLVALVFKVLPDVEFAWRDVWLGAAITAFLFVVGQSVLGWYLGRQSSSSLYGAAGSLIVFLLWIYYSAQIFLFGAEFTQIYATRYGEGVRPAENAVPRHTTPVKFAAQASNRGMAQRATHLSPAAADRMGQTWVVAAASLENMSLGELVKGLIDDARKLLHQEIQLARAELQASLKRVTRGAALTAGGGLVLYAGAIAILFAVALLLSMIMPIWLAALLVGLLAVIEGWIMIVSARSKLRQMNLIPTQTIETLREDYEVVKDRVTS